MAIKQLKIEKSFTVRESKSFEKYLNDVSKISLITSEQEVMLAKRIKQGDREALGELVRANLRFVISVAKRYQNNGLTIEDLVNEGNLGLMKAAERFDETRGFKFISFAVWWVRQTILQALADNARMVRIPLNKINVVSKYNQMTASLEQKLGRVPDIMEICAEMGLDTTAKNFTEGEKSGDRYSKMHGALGDVNDVLVCLNRTYSMDNKVSEDDGDSQTMVDIMEDENSLSPESVLMDKSAKIDIKRCLDKLSYREAAVIKSYFGLDCNALTLEEIGENLGLTRERARQIKEKALRRLKQSFMSKTLKQHLQ